MILTTWRCSPAKSFVLNEGRLWSCLCTTRFYTYTDATRIALSHTRSFSYSVCPPFVILSEANHVRRRGCSLISIHAENRSGGDVDSWPRVLWKYCPIRVWGRENRNICEFDLFPNFVEPHRFAFFRMKGPSKRFLWFGRSAWTYLKVNGIENWWLRDKTRDEVRLWIWNREIIKL